MESRQQLLVTSKALPGREQEYLAWYLNQHLGDVLAVPGFISGQLLRSLDPGGQDIGEFKALYEVESLEPSVIFGALMERAAQMDLSDALDPASVTFTFLVAA